MKTVLIHTGEVAMNNRERLKAIMNYENCDRVPVVHFGLWNETLDKWVNEGLISKEEAEGHSGGNPPESAMERLGFDFGWCHRGFGANTGLDPAFKIEVVEELPDGSQKVRNNIGVIVLQSPGVTSIPSEIDHTLKDRKSWEEQFLPRLQFSEDRVKLEDLNELKGKSETEDFPLCLGCGSVIGIHDTCGHL